MSTTKQTIEITHEQYVNFAQWMLLATKRMLEQESKIDELRKELSKQKAVTKELRGLFKERTCSCHGSTTKP